MRFAIILSGVIILTLFGIFGFYRLFLDKPGSPDNPQASPSISPNSHSVDPVSLIPPSDTPTPTPTPKPSPSPKPTPSVVLLQDNLISQTSSQTSSSTPTGSATISGTISLSGTIPSGTSMVIVARTAGTNNSYQTVVSGIQAVNNASWSWTSAKSGTNYDMIVILKGSSGGVDTDYADSQVFTVAAPAYKQIFSLNAGFNMDAPTGAITITCGPHNSNNTWDAKVNFTPVSGAQYYWLQVGSTSGGDDLANVKANTQTVSVNIKDSIEYFARYSTASVSNPTQAQYSPFSNVSSVKCP